MKNKIISILVTCIFLFTSLISVNAIAPTPTIELNDYQLTTTDINNVYINGTVNMCVGQMVGLFDYTGNYLYNYVQVKNTNSKGSFKIQIPSVYLKEGNNTFKVKSLPIRGVINGSNPKTFTVKVNSKKQDQTITANDLTVYVGEIKKLNAKVTSGLSLSYEVENPEIVTIDPVGNVIGRNEGKTKVTIIQSGNDIYNSTKTSINITVKKKENVTPTPPITKTYTIVYNSNGGNGKMSNQTVKEGTKVTLYANKFSKSGYTFKGWSTTKGGEVVYKNKQSITVNKNLNLYAVWKNNKVFIGKNVVVMGDSIQAGHGKFAVVAAQKLGAKKVINKSQSGRTISYVKGKAARTNSVLYQLKHNSWYKKNLKHSKYIMLVAGTNDYAWGSITTGRLKTDTKESIKYIRKYNKNSIIVVVTPLRRWSGKSESTGVEKYRKKIVEATKGYKNIYVIDGKTLVKSNEYSNFSDRLHPNTSFAKKTLANRLVKEIQNKLI